jgi:hypothetical protein
MKKKNGRCQFCGTPCDPRVITCSACSVKRRTTPAADRLIKHSRRDESTGCLEFMGFRLPNGYGRIKGERTVELAHRAAWKAWCGPIPDGLCVLHRCDNRCCVEPTHLFLGTHQDNVSDMIQKGRKAPPANTPGAAHIPRGEGHWNARLTEQQVAEIRMRANEPRKKLAAEFGVTYRYISHLICGRKRTAKGSRRMQ